MIQYKFEFKHRKKLIFLQSFKNRNITIFIIIIGKVLSTLFLVY